MFGDVGRKKMQTTTNSLPSSHLCVSVSARAWGWDEGPAPPACVCPAGRRAREAHMSLNHCHLTYRAGSGLPQAKDADSLWGPVQATCVWPEAHHQNSVSNTLPGLGWPGHNPSTLEWTQPLRKPSLGQTPKSSGRENWLWRSLRDQAMKY